MLKNKKVQINCIAIESKNKNLKFYLKIKK